MEKFVCPRCKKTALNKKYEKDGLYVCSNILPEKDNCVCGKIIAIKCNNCNKFLSEDRFGLRGDVYECKQCGTPQWGYTEYKRERAAIMNEINSYLQFMKSNLNDLNDKYRI